MLGSANCASGQELLQQRILNDPSSRLVNKSRFLPKRLCNCQIIALSCALLAHVFKRRAVDTQWSRSRPGLPGPVAQTLHCYVLSNRAVV
eukprot:5169170-Pyramimonas_sp.AAC.1